MDPISPDLTICGLRDLVDPAGHTSILSLVDPEWPTINEFASWPATPRVELRFHYEISALPRKRLPTAKHVAEILALGRSARLRGGDDTSVLVDCQSGVSRSTAAALMIWADANFVLPEDGLFHWLRKRRPQAWPNFTMVREADLELGRNGR